MDRLLPLILVKAELDNLGSLNEVLTKGMTLKIVRHQDPLEIGMSFESYSEHVERFALEKIRTGPDHAQGRHDRVVLVERNAQSDVPQELKRMQMIDHGEPRIARQVSVIDPAEIRQ